MDTNQTLHITSFTGGMNTDTSYDTLNDKLYVMSMNNRVSTIKYDSSTFDSTYSNQKEGLLAPVLIGEYSYKLTLMSGVDGSKHSILEYNYIYANNIYKILTSGDTSIILYKGVSTEGDTDEDGESINHYYLNVGKLVDGKKGDPKYIHLLFCVELPNDLDNVSAVLNGEQEDVVNLYIATGSSQLLQVNVIDEEYIAKLYEGDGVLINIDYITSNSYFPYDKLIIDDLIYGQLKTSQIQYTYRFYKKHGICSKLAPLTNKILVINPDKTQDTGCAEDTVTCTGFRVKVPTDILTEASKLFDRLLIYRICYIKVDTDAEVKLLFDGKFDENFSYNDTKQEGIQELTMEEFSGMSGLSLNPNVISQNQKYLFCGDVVDKTIITFDDAKSDEIKTWYRTFRVTSKNSQKEHKINGESLTGITDGEGLYNYIFSSSSASKVGYDYMSKYDLMNRTTNEDKILWDTECHDLNNYLGGVGRYISWKFVFTGIPSGSVDSSLNTTISVDTVTPYTSFYVEHDSDDVTVFHIDSEVDNININATYLKGKSINMSPASEQTGGYSNNIISSTLRSLRHNEVYRYGIVFYDKYGNRTNVFWIQDIKTPSIMDMFGPVMKADNSTIGYVTGLFYKPNKSNNIFSLSIGIKFDVIIPDYLREQGIIGYEIVRCEKNISNTKNMYQTVLNRPVRQVLGTGESSSYYATGFITTQPCRIVPWNADPSHATLSKIPMGPKSSRDAITENLVYDSKNSRITRVTYASIPSKQIFQCFCPEYYIHNKDVLNNLKSNQITLSPQCYINPDDVSNPIKDDGSLENINKLIYSSGGTLSNFCPWELSSNKNHFITIDRRKFTTLKSTKLRSGIILPMTYAFKAIPCNTLYKNIYELDISLSVCSFNDSKNPTWSDGFSNVKVDGDVVKSGVMKYQTFVTNATTYSYLNWICNGKYGYPIGANSGAEKPGGGWTDDDWNEIGEYGASYGGTKTDEYGGFFSEGPIGPGGPCMIITVDMPDKIEPGGDTVRDEFLAWNNYLKLWSLDYTYLYPYFGTYLCNMQHQAVQFSGITEAERKYDAYYGFGNYTHVTKFGSSNPSTNIVFDGDVYPDMQEIYTMFKAWDFNDSTAYLHSTQIIYYIPMESTVNWRFDYGMNYKNTSNKNLELEPCEITGVSAQERPLRQYNSIYSDNNTSNNIFNVVSEDDSVNTYHQRLFYSELKTPGEAIDNWQIFKSTNCIDTSSEYGKITDLYTFKDVLYVWQEKAFSKLSVNERSLVKDENSNTIQLGQGEVLQRVDYISTNYGMRQYDMCKVNAEGVLYWFDYYNKCIAALADNKVVDYTNTKNIKSLMNDYNDNRRPSLVYDSSHKEVLFSTINPPVGNTKQILAINVEQNIPVGLYNCKYSKILQYDKDCISMSDIDDDTKIGEINSYNGTGDKSILIPTYIQFVVNNNPSITKVFDNQQIITGKRNVNYDNSITKKSYFDDKTLKFSTNICDAEITSADELDTTDREGNIKYAIPRCNSTDEYGNRVRGKYMLESITDSNPDKDSTISHIITKYRISYN